MNLSLRNFVAAGVFGLLLANTAQSFACDRAHLTVNSVTPTSNGRYSISLTMCAGGGYTNGAYGADQNTGDFAFIVEGATIVQYPAQITSPQTGAVYTPTPYSQDTVLYSNPTMWWACINESGCGGLQTVCQTVTFEFSALPTKIRLLGMEGGGNPDAACSGPSMEVQPSACGSFAVNAGSDVTLKGSAKCANLTATVTGGTATSYSWSTGGTTATVNVCPSVTTVYTVTVTDRNGCISVDDVSVIKSGGGKPKGGGTGAGAVPGGTKFK